MNQPPNHAAANSAVALWLQSMRPAGVGAGHGHFVREKRSRPMTSKRICFAAALLLCATSLCGAEATVTLTGKMTDGAAKPLGGATVMVYYAGVKKGYSTYCPSCYADCGKRATTDDSGSFVIKGLSPDLWFTLLVVRDGHAPTFVKRIDPAAGPVSAKIPAREIPGDPSQLLFGRVVGENGRPIANAVISPEELSWQTPSGPAGGVGAIDGLDPIAISNDKGEFEVAFNKPGIHMTLDVEARGMAPKRFKELPMGEKRHNLKLTEGATVFGRVMHNGKPLANAEMGLVSLDRGREFYSEIRIGTGADGQFLFSNVPARGDWYVYPKMESIVELGSARPVRVSTKEDGEMVKVADITLVTGNQVRGQVILTDGKPIPQGMTIGIHAQSAWDSQIVPLAPDGRFGFKNVPADDYNISPAVKGYRLSPRNPNLAWTVEGFVDGDVEDLVILLDPGKDDFAGRSGGKFKGKPFRSAERPKKPD